MDLPVDECQSLLDLLSPGARARGLRHELWTLGRVAAVMQRHFDITYCPSGVWRVLRRNKWSPQKLARRVRPV